MLVVRIGDRVVIADYSYALAITSKGLAEIHFYKNNTNKTYKIIGIGQFPVNTYPHWSGRCVNDIAIQGETDGLIVFIQKRFINPAEPICGCRICPKCGYRFD